MSVRALPTGRLLQRLIEGHKREIETISAR